MTRLPSTSRVAEDGSVMGLHRVGRRRLRLALLGVVGALLAGVAVVAILPADATVTRTYRPLDGPIANPERGWYDRVETILTQRDFSESTRDGVTLLHSYVRLDDYRDRAIPASVLEQLSDGLDAVREQGLTIIVRFAYNEGPYPASEPDATQARVLQHIRQLGPVLQQHRDVVAAVEAGFIGAWGEWHTSTNGLDTNASAKRTILRAERDAFPGQLVLRYPADLRALASSSKKRTVGGTGLTSSVGSHQDCFLSSDDDSGTWGRDGSSTAADKKLVAHVGRYAIVGGETCNPSPPARTSCDVALTEMAQMHFTYLNRDYEPNSLAKLEPCREEITERLGYRLELTSARMPGTLSPRATSLPLRLTLRNVGFASPYEERPVYAVLTCGTQVQRLRLDTDPRTWDPGSTIVIDQTVELRNRPTGTACRLGLWIPDASDELRDEPAYAIRLASRVDWSGGVNDLGRIPVARS